MNLNHNTLALIVPTIVAIGLFLLVYAIPEIGFAPQETTGKVMLKVAIFMAAWPVALRFMGGWKYSITAEGKKTAYGMVALACAIILGLAQVIASR